MGFEALRREDLTDLAAINDSYLEFLAGNGGHAARQLESLEPAAREMIRRLPAASRAEVAKCPVLLCSVRSVDVGRVDSTGNFELFRGSTPTMDLIAYMSFSLLRRIAWRRPFVARLLGGIDSEWCEALAALDDPGLALLAHVQGCRLRPVHAAVPGFWPELLQCAELAPLRRHAVRAAGLQLQQHRPPPLPGRIAASRVRASRHRPA
ncbi:MAG: hypothetical protein P8172_03955 [Gammaproteobacteria bacterium]